MDTKAAIIVGIVIILAGAFLFTRSSESPQTTQTEIEPTTEVVQEAEGGEQKMKYDKAPEMTIDESKSYVAILHTTKGDITIDLFTKDAPLTVNNFVFLAREKFYDGTIFHRVIKEFMIQGGDPQGTGMGGPGYKFADEFQSPHTFDKPGLLAMANSGPNTNGSQFFITTVVTNWLDGKHTIFGEVTKGMDIVTAIENTQVGPGDKPAEDVKIKSVEIIEK